MTRDPRPEAPPFTAGSVTHLIVYVVVLILAIIVGSMASDIIEDQLFKVTQALEEVTKP